MTFRELLNLYKAGSLDEARRREVEEAIDREDAILGYLAEQDALPEPESFGTEIEREGADPMEQRFQRELSRGIRRAFVRLGICVGAVLLAALLLVQFVLPHAADLFYYDPGEIAAVHEGENGGYKTNRMSLDLAVYSELFLPGGYRENVNIFDRGYGTYDLIIVQNVTTTGRFTDVAGRIDKNRLILYDRNTLKAPVGNAFEWGLNHPDPALSLSEQVRPPETDENGVTYWSAGMAGYPEDARQRLAELPEGRYRGFVSLDRVMDYDAFASFAESRGLGSVWCAVQVSENPSHASNVGFSTDWGSGGNLLCWDQEKYPQLKRDAFAGRNGEDQWTIRSAEDAKTHLISLLRYLGDQPRFRAMMAECLGVGAAETKPMVEWVQAHGVQVYGFSLIADKETLLALQDCPEVYSVAAQPVD